MKKYYLHERDKHQCCLHNDRISSSQVSPEEGCRPLFIIMENSIDIVPHYSASDVSAVNEGVHIEDQKPFSTFVTDDPFLTDVWIGIILILMVLICVGYICTCILYHKFRRWKREVLETQRTLNTRESFHDEYVYEESLPSYTIVTGLPSYDQAMEQFRQLRSLRKASSPKIAEVEDAENPPPSTTAFARLSLGEIFQFYKVDKSLPV